MKSLPNSRTPTNHLFSSEHTSQRDGARSRQPEVFDWIACVAVPRWGSSPRVCPLQTIPLFMAKTKQTAQKRTGGRFPCKQVATKAARLSREERDAREAIMWKLSEQTDLKKLSKTTGDPEPYPYHVWVGMRLTRYDLNRTEMVRLFGRQIPIYLAARGDRGVLVDELSRLGLTESHV